MDDVTPHPIRAQGKRSICKLVHPFLNGLKHDFILFCAYFKSKYYLKIHSYTAKSCDNWVNLIIFAIHSILKCFHPWWLRSWVGLHTDIGVFWTLWFWRSKNLASSNSLSKTKQRERPVGCLYTSHFDTFAWGSSQSRGFDIFIGVGLSTLLVSTNWAMREPLLREASDKTGSTFLFVCQLANTIILCLEGPRQNILL